MIALLIALTIPPGDHKDPLAVFPDQARIDNALARNKAVDDFLDAAMIYRPWQKDMLQAYKNKNTSLWLTWKYLDWARMYHEDPTYHINALRERIGDANFHTGTMPEDSLFFLIPEID